MDLFCRTWKVVNSPSRGDIGVTVLFSNAGTYFVYEPDGSGRLISHWKWFDDRNEELEYSHDNWQNKGNVKNIELRANYLKFVDLVGTYELEPANN